MFNALLNSVLDSIFNRMRMETIVFLVAICLTTVSCLPRQRERIIGGSVISINTYPFAGSVQTTQNNVQFRHSCGCTIINNRSVVTAAHCVPRGQVASRFQVRLGSNYVSSGGTVIRAAQLIGHPNYNTWNHNNDIGVIRMANAIPIGSRTIRAGNLAAATSNVPDDVIVIAIGWGFTTPTGNPSEQLRHVQIRSVNQAQCQRIYGANRITPNMICAIWPQGGRGSCFGDSGTGLLLNNVVVGITSFGRECASAHWPGVYARVSQFNDWIRNNA